MASKLAGKHDKRQPQTLKSAQGDSHFATTKTVISRAGQVGPQQIDSMMKGGEQRRSELSSKDNSMVTTTQMKFEFN